jgi:hypothetical protein
MGGMNPEMKFLFTKNATKPVAMNTAALYSTAPINYMDAVFTTIGSAAVYKSAYDEAIAEGANETVAAEIALDALDAAIYRFSQPTGFGSKGLKENDSHIWIKSMMLFMSDARLKTGIMWDAMEGLATGRGDRATHIKNIAVIEAMAIVSWFVSNVYRDTFSDEEDDEIWTVGGFVRALVLAPLSGFFVLGAVSESVVAKLAGEGWFPPSRDPLLDIAGRGQRVTANIEDTFNLDDPDAMFKQWNNIARMMAISPAMAAPAAMLNLIKPIQGAIKNAEAEE